MAPPQAKPCGCIVVRGGWQHRTQFRVAVCCACRRVLPQLPRGWIRLCRVANACRPAALRPKPWESGGVRQYCCATVAHAGALWLLKVHAASPWCMFPPSHAPPPPPPPPCRDPILAQGSDASDPGIRLMADQFSGVRLGRVAASRVAPIAGWLQGAGCMQVRCRVPTCTNRGAAQPVLSGCDSVPACSYSVCGAADHAHSACPSCCPPSPSKPCAALRATSLPRYQSGGPTHLEFPLF